MIFRSRSKFPIKQWKNRFVGETAFLIGNGPSLIDNDLDIIKDRFTIAINRGYKAITPVILLWQDESLYKDCLDELRILPCAKVTRSGIDSDDIFTHFVLGKGGFTFTNDPSKLCGGGCTVALAVQMIVSMGFSSIVLLGCDGRYRGDKTNFYGVNPNHTANTLANFDYTMRWIRSECPRKIVNCSDTPYWPKVSLEQAVFECNTPKRPRIEWLNRLM
jgi:hypothetical protein